MNKRSISGAVHSRQMEAAISTRNAASRSKGECFPYALLSKKMESIGNQENQKEEYASGLDPNPRRRTGPECRHPTNCVGPNRPMMMRAVPQGNLG